MARSLKERYEIKKVTSLKERLAVVDQQVLEENKLANLIIETMSQDDLDKISAIVDKLERIKDAAGRDKNLQVLTNAIDTAIQDVNKYAAGGPLSAAWTKLKAKVGVDNPIVKVATFANALESGFKQVPKILRNNGIDLKKLGDGTGNVTLRDAIARQLDSKNKKTAGLGEDSQGGFNSTVGNGNKSAPSIDTKDIEAMGKSDASSEAAQKLKIVIDQIRKALSPRGIFGAFKKIPYVDGAALAQGMANAQIGVLNTIASTIKSGPQTDEVAADLKQNVVGQGEAETKGTEPAASTRPTSGTTPSTPDKGTIPGGMPSAGVGETPAAGPGQTRGGGAEKQKSSKLDDAAVKDLAQFLARKTKIDPDAVLKVLTALNASEKLR